MHIFDMPLEIRLKIYSELLVSPEQVIFKPDYGSSSLPNYGSLSLRRLRPKGDGLCPALLRTNKRIYREANTLLYYNNRFRFPRIFTLPPIETVVTHIAPFLTQIGSQASHIRHICITFPQFASHQPDKPGLHKAEIENMVLVRDTCTSLRTLELLVPQYSQVHVLSDSPIAAEILHLLDTHIKNISSLEEIVINFEACPGEKLSDNLIHKMHEYGWTVKTTEYPRGLWISMDHRAEFANVEDCQAYDNELLLEQYFERVDAERSVKEYHWR